MKASNPKERLREFVKSVGLGETAFETKVGLSRGAISKMKETSGITSKVIDKIKIHYPNANTSWLLTGEGDLVPAIKNDHDPLPNERSDNVVQDGQEKLNNVGDADLDKLLAIVKEQSASIFNLSATMKSQADVMKQQANSVQVLIEQQGKNLKTIEARQLTIAKVQSQVDDAVLEFVAKQQNLKPEEFLEQVYNRSSPAQDRVSNIMDIERAGI